MPEMIDGVPACYGCIETTIIQTGDCLCCKHVNGCKLYAEKLKRDWAALLSESVQED